MKILVELILRAFILLVTTYFVPGFKIDSYTTALVVVLVLAILNMFVKPIFVFFTLPATIVSLGLFIFVINALLLYISANLIQGFSIDSFLTAIIAAIFISVLSTVLNIFFR